MKGPDDLVAKDAGLNRALRPSGPSIGAIALALAPVGLMSACGPAGNDPAPGGVTVDEARALEQAAEMIEARHPPPELLDGAVVAAPQPPTAPPGTPGEDGAQQSNVALEQE